MVPKGSSRRYKIDSVIPCCFAKEEEMPPKSKDSFELTDTQTNSHDIETESTKTLEDKKEKDSHRLL